MNQERIGKFLAECRKNKNMTQQELASRLNVTDKAISKWENGRGLPDPSLFQNLCKILDISVNELLAGERESNDDSIIEYANYTKRKSHRKILIISFIATLILVIIILAIYFINSYNKIVVYRLSGKNDNFIYSNGIVITSNIKNVLVLGRIGIINDFVKDYDITKVCIKASADNLIACSNPFEGIFIESYGYEEVFNSNKINNIDNWYLEITYSKNNTTKTDIIPIENSLVMRNNKLIIKKSPHI